MAWSSTERRPYTNFWCSRVGRRGHSIFLDKILLLLHRRGGNPAATHSITQANLDSIWTLSFTYCLWSLKTWLPPIHLLSLWIRLSYWSCSLSNQNPSIFVTFFFFFVFFFYSIYFIYLFIFFFNIYFHLIELNLFNSIEFTAVLWKSWFVPVGFPLWNFHLIIQSRWMDSTIKCANIQPNSVGSS